MLLQSCANKLESEVRRTAPFSKEDILAAFGSSKTEFRFLLDDSVHEYLTFERSGAKVGFLFRDQELIGATDARSISYRKCLIQTEFPVTECLAVFRDQLVRYRSDIDRKFRLPSLGLGLPAFPALAVVVIPAAIVIETTRNSAHDSFSFELGQQIEKEDAFFDRRDVTDFKVSNGTTHVLTSMGKNLVAFGTEDKILVWIEHEPSYFKCSNVDCDVSLD